MDQVYTCESTLHIQQVKLYSEAMKNIRHIFTLCLLTLTLVGVQALQASPLHDHATHVVDCGLCHFNATESAVEESPTTGFTLDAASYVLNQAVTATYPKTHSPFLGRAPPPLH